MIAKSDTTRQDGRGEAEYAQYEAAVEVYRIADLMKRKHKALEPVLVSVKNGGGHALQRGGGRVTEIPAVHGRAAADARVTDIGPSTLTIQGQQQTILFCPGKVAIGSLEAFAAQNLYTKAGIQGEMRPPRFSKNANRQYARADAWLYAKTAGKAFDDLIKNNPAIDELFVAAPWLAMKAGNVSSRPAGRGEKQLGPGITPAEAKGKNPRALEGRAISGERLSAHACLPVFSVLGLVEAMEAVRHEGTACANPEKYGDALHHLYRAHKIQRDAARATANVVAMADFDIAWPLLTGSPRPDKKRVYTLAQQFVCTDKPHVNAPEVTLAFLEEYFLTAETLTYGMVSGQTPPKTMRHGDALQKLWPELAVQVSARNRNAEFARVIECHRSRAFDAAPDVPLSEAAFRITQALYASANVINAPVGILATRTKLEPVKEIDGTGKTAFMRPKSYQEKKIIHLLEKPAALRTM
jgi:phosphoenolpyruvate carboxylase